MIQAKLETKNFTFTAYAGSTNQALSILKQGLAKHAKQYNLLDDWWHDFQSNIQINYIKLCHAYRDNDLLKIE